MFELINYGTLNPFSALDVFSEASSIDKYLFGRQLPAFKTDIRESEDAFILESELPGFSKEEIRVEIKENKLHISAEHKSDSEEKESDNYVRRERSYGSFSRSFNLKGISTDEITASHKDGVLCVILPKEKHKEDSGRILEIN